MAKSYLGDGVYVDVDERGIILTAEKDGDVSRPDRHTIVLETETWRALLRYVDSRLEQKFLAKARKAL